MAEAVLTVARLKSLLHYDPETGVFTRRVARTNAPAGSIAGSKRDDGYLTIYIGHAYTSHRLAWFYFYDRWPASQIDHINGNRSDNRISNLREVTRSQNSQNIGGAYRNNVSSGLLGAYRHEKGKWHARIQLNGKANSLGLFDTPEAAHAAYLAAKAVIHTHGSRLAASHA